jgi:hypothetical protein
VEKIDAFGCFKPAVVLEGIRARFLERKGCRC